jgi:hypothetical protein
MRIDGDRLLKQSQSFDHPLFRYRIEGRKRAQVEIIRAEVGRRPQGGASHLCRLQCRLDNAGDAYRYLVLQFENVFETEPRQRAVRSGDREPDSLSLRMATPPRCTSQIPTE